MLLHDLSSSVARTNRHMKNTFVLLPRRLFGIQLHIDLSANSQRFSILPVLSFSYRGCAVILPTITHVKLHVIL